MTSKRSTDAPQNLVELHRWREQRSAYACDDWYLKHLDRKWRMIGRLARDPSALRGVENHT